MFETCAASGGKWYSILNYFWKTASTLHARNDYIKRIVFKSNKTFLACNNNTWWETVFSKCTVSIQRLSNLY